MLDEPIQVHCYPGGGGDEIPKTVIQGALRRDVVEVLERWVEERPDPNWGRRRWFRVQFLDGTNATIYNDLPGGTWFQRRRSFSTPEAGSPAGD